MKVFSKGVILNLHRRCNAVRFTLNLNMSNSNLHAGVVIVNNGGITKDEADFIAVKFCFTSKFSLYDLVGEDRRVGGSSLSAQRR